MPIHLVYPIDDLIQLILNVVIYCPDPIQDQVIPLIIRVIKKRRLILFQQLVHGHRLRSPCPILLVLILEQQSIHPLTIQHHQLLIMQLLLQLIDLLLILLLLRLQLVQILMPQLQGLDEMLQLLLNLYGPIPYLVPELYLLHRVRLPLVELLLVVLVYFDLGLEGHFSGLEIVFGDIDVLGAAPAQADAHDLDLFDHPGELVGIHCYYYQVGVFQGNQCGDRGVYESEEVLGQEEGYHLFGDLWLQLLQLLLSGSCLVSHDLPDLGGTHHRHITIQHFLMLDLIRLHLISHPWNYHELDLLHQPLSFPPTGQSIDQITPYQEVELSLWILPLQTLHQSVSGNHLPRPYLPVIDLHLRSLDVDISHQVVPLLRGKQHLLIRSIATGEYPCFVDFFGFEGTIDHCEMGEVRRVEGSTVHQYSDLVQPILHHFLHPGSLLIITFDHTLSQSRYNRIIVLGERGQKEVYNMNPGNLISIISSEARSPETYPYVIQVKKSNQAISKAAIEAIKQVLSHTQYKAKSKLFALKFLKDCFEQADPYFVHEVESEILPLLVKIIRDSDQPQSFAAYLERQCVNPTELRAFKSELFTMFIFSKQCIQNWALWMTITKRKQNPYFVLKSTLESQRIAFPIQNKYFQPKNQQNFMLNYQTNLNKGRSEQIQYTPQQPIFSPSYSSKESRYSKKLDLILLELSELGEGNSSSEQKRREIDRLSNVFEEVIGNYMASAEEFDERFVNDYYSRLEMQIKEVQRKGNSQVNNRNLEWGRNSQVSNQRREESVQDPYLMRINHPPQLSKELLKAFPPSQMQIQSQGLSRESSVVSNVSRSSSAHPPIRIPSVAAYPTSQVISNPSIQIPTPGSGSPPMTPHLPYSVEEIKYQPNSTQQPNGKKSVLFNENLNQIREYPSPQRPFQSPNNVEYYSKPPQTPQIIEYSLPIQPTIPRSPSNQIKHSPQFNLPPKSPSQIPHSQNNFSINPQIPDPKPQSITYQLDTKNRSRTSNQNLLAQKLLRQRRQNFQLSQHMLSLELKIESLFKQAQQKQRDQQAERLFYRSHSKSNTINTPTFSSNLLQRAKSNTSRVDDNFFKEEELVHGLEIKLKEVLGWTNINKFKLSVLGATSILYKDSKIKVTVGSQQVFNKGVLCLEQIVKVKTKAKHESIEIKYKNNKELDLWTKPFQYNSSDEIHQSLICNVVSTPLPIVQANVLLDGIGTKIVLPILLINLLVNGNVSSDKFRNAFTSQQKYILRSKIIQLNPATVPKPSVFHKYFICSQKVAGKDNIIECGLLYPYTQTLILMEIEILNNQRGVFRVLEVGSRDKRVLGKELMDNLMFLFSA